MTFDRILVARILFTLMTAGWAMPERKRPYGNAYGNVLPLAILSAFLEARRPAIIMREISSSAVPKIRPTSGIVICCDNFA
jgi:hypothetical protein